MKSSYASGLCLALIATLTACGGGGNANLDAVAAAVAARTTTGSIASTPKGSIIDSKVTQQHSTADVDTAMQSLTTSAAGATPAASDMHIGAVESRAGDAICGVTIQHLTYSTLDPQGAPATATTALMVPNGTSADCTGSRPVLLYAHGTTTLKSYNAADPAKTPEAMMVEAYYAAHGYIVVMPNYLGYDTSSLSYHPYLNAEVQANDMIDGLRAGLAQVASDGKAQASKQLFIAGYSQGGHVAMATHKVLERDHANEFTVTAAGTMSGPYDLVQFGDDITSPDGTVDIGGVLFMPYLMRSYQNAYGGMYLQPSDVYQAPFDQTAPTIFPTDTPVSTLIANGSLPNDPTFRLLFGPGGLLTDSFRNAYPTSNFRAALARNTLLGWTPKAPVALCGGLDDPTVYYSNTTSMRDDFATRGLKVPTWDLETRSTLPEGKDASDIYDGFQLAKLKAGKNWEMKYHGELVPPFCHALVRGFFAQAMAKQ
ncbi:prolyl oligopeptidase family serine peptidase [Variovorax robiniae]|uniref:Prolyl oligopeptidase family serine peptidase n=1 Tax=Variovorax robiniae TaxID=1836199 RepID=A0ABU8X5Z1_9BURK